MPHNDFVKESEMNFRLVIFLLLLLLFPPLLFSQVFPGTFPFEPVVNPTTQASSF
jgi:hypothetical protein